MQVRRPAMPVERLAVRVFCRHSVFASCASSDADLSWEYKVRVGTNRDFGGCRRLGRAEEHIRALPARELSLLLLPRDARGVHLGTPTNRKCRRVAAPSTRWAPRTCRQVLASRPASTALVAEKTRVMYTKNHALTPTTTA